MVSTIVIVPSHVKNNRLVIEIDGYRIILCIWFIELNIPGGNLKRYQDLSTAQLCLHHLLQIPHPEETNSTYRQSAPRHLPEILLYFPALPVPSLEL